MGILEAIKEQRKLWEDLEAVRLKTLTEQENQLYNAVYGNESSFEDFSIPVTNINHELDTDLLKVSNTGNLKKLEQTLNLKKGCEGFAESKYYSEENKEKESLYDIVNKTYIRDTENSSWVFSNYSSMKLGVLSLASSYNYKKVHKDLNIKIEDSNFPITGNPSKAVDNISALQTIHEIPLAFFNYNNEPDWAKSYLGIITERLQAVASSDKSLLENAVFTEVEDSAYEYTDEQFESITKMVNLVTDNENKAQNAITSLGLLLQGAKETQDRLLKLEYSIFGKDFSERPGDKPEIDTSNLNEEFLKGISQLPTDLGLNRLIRSLSKEVFEDFNPLLPNMTTDSGETKSELELVSNAVFGDIKNKIKLFDSVEEQQAYSLVNPKTIEIGLDNQEENVEIITCANESITRLFDKVSTLTKLLNKEDDITQYPDLLVNLMQSNFYGELDYLKDYWTGEVNLISKIDTFVEKTFNYDGLERDGRVTSIKSIDGGENKPIENSEATNLIKNPTVENRASFLDVVYDTIGNEVLPRSNDLSKRTSKTLATRIDTIEKALDVMGNSIISPDSDMKFEQVLNGEVDNVTDDIKTTIGSFFSFLTCLSSYLGIEIKDPDELTYIQRTRNGRVDNDFVEISSAFTNVLGGLHSIYSIVGFESNETSLEDLKSKVDTSFPILGESGEAPSMLVDLNGEAWSFETTDFVSIINSLKKYIEYFIGRLGSLSESFTDESRNNITNSLNFLIQKIEANAIEIKSNQTIIENATSEATADTLAQRDSEGALNVEMATAPTDTSVINKGFYVEDIDERTTAILDKVKLYGKEVLSLQDLDSILTTQENLIKVEITDSKDSLPEYIRELPNGEYYFKVGTIKKSENLVSQTASLLNDIVLTISREYTGTAWSNFVLANEFTIEQRDTLINSGWGIKDDYKLIERENEVLEYLNTIDSNRVIGVWVDNEALMPNSEPFVVEVFCNPEIETLNLKAYGKNGKVFTSVFKLNSDKINWIEVLTEKTELNLTNSFITINETDITLLKKLEQLEEPATSEANGLMLKEDKIKLDSLTIPEVDSNLLVISNVDELKTFLELGVERNDAFENKTKILIKNGEYDIEGEVLTDFSLYKNSIESIEGESYKGVIIKGAISFTNFEGNYIKNLVLESTVDTAIKNSKNILDCIIQGSVTTGFLDCENIKNCNVVNPLTMGFSNVKTLENCTVSNGTIPFSNCSHLTNCYAKRTSTDGVASPAFETCNFLVGCESLGFLDAYSNCENLVNCLASLEVELELETEAKGFDTCKNLTNCFAKGFKQGFINSNNIVNCTVESIEGFSNCKALRNCEANNTTTAFLECVKVSSCIANEFAVEGYIGFKDCELVFESEGSFLNSFASYKEEAIRATSLRKGGSNIVSNLVAITYNFQDGEDEIVISANVGETITLPIPEGRAGYNFLGWIDELNDASLDDSSITVTGDLNLKANWALIDYPITYNLNEGEQNEGNPTSYNILSDIELKEPTKEAHLFTGWFNGDSEKVESISAGSTGDLVLTANWELSS